MNFRALRVQLRDVSLRREVDAMLASSTGATAGAAGKEPPDAAALRVAVRRLGAELEMRAKWEALRLAHLLQMVEDKAAAANAKLLDDQRVRADPVKPQDTHGGKNGDAGSAHPPPPHHHHHLFLPC